MAAVKKRTPAEYITRMINSLDSRSGTYNSATVDRAFASVLDILYDLNAHMNNLTRAKLPALEFHPQDDRQFIQKVVQELVQIIKLYTTDLTAEIITLVGRAIHSLTELSQRITDFQYARREQRDADAQAAAHGDDSDESDTSDHYVQDGP